MTILDDTFLALLCNVEAAAPSVGKGRLDQIGSLLIDSLYRAALVTQQAQAVPYLESSKAA